jgi:hypothetical protein
MKRVTWSVAGGLLVTVLLYSLVQEKVGVRSLFYRLLIS